MIIPVELINQKGEVAECTGDNIFLVRAGRLLTPPNEAGILEGITRDAVMDLARRGGIGLQKVLYNQLKRPDEPLKPQEGSGAENDPAMKKTLKTD